MAWPFLWFVPPIIQVLRRFRPGTGAGAYIPTSLLRYVAFKLHVDIQKVRRPAPGAWSSAGLCADQYCAMRPPTWYAEARSAKLLLDGLLPPFIGGAAGRLSCTCTLTGHHMAMLASC